MATKIRLLSALLLVICFSQGLYAKSKKKAEKVFVQPQKTEQKNEEETTAGTGEDAAL